MLTTIQACMRSINRRLKTVYNADKVAIIPGSGTYAMEAVARQFATNKSVMVLRNGYFSFRWSEIFDICKICSHESIVKAQCMDKSNTPQMVPLAASTVAEMILNERPDVVFAPQVETSTGIILPESYLKTICDAVHKVSNYLKFFLVRV